MSRNLGKGAARKPANLFACAAAAAIAAGCATQTEYARTATYGAPSNSHYTGADRVFRNGYVENLQPDSLAATARPDARVLAAFDGIDGARLAHRMYNDGQAEKLDGACEQYVKISQGENLYDIAQLCDVPVTMLIDYNPAVNNPRHVGVGQIVEVPQIFNAERNALLIGDVNTISNGTQLASYYVVQPGDTLNDIAAKHLVSASAVANFNPGVQWASLPVGAQVRIPVVQPAGVVAPANPAPVTGALPYAYGSAANYQAGAASAAASNALPTSVPQPYSLTPAQEPDQPYINKAPLLTVDRRTVKAGGSVIVSAVDLPPNAAISIYQGPNGSDLDFVTTIFTDSQGRFSTPVTVRGVSSAGGVIFRATIDKTGDQLQSPRVGIDTIKPE